MPPIPASLTSAQRRLARERVIRKAARLSRQRTQQDAADTEEQQQEPGGGERFEEPGGEERVIRKAAQLARQRTQRDAHVEELEEPGGGDDDGLRDSSSDFEPDAEPDAELKTAEVATKRNRATNSKAKRVYPRYTRPREKRRSRPLPSAIQAAADRAKAAGVAVNVPSFGHTRFETFEEFADEWVKYVEKNYLCYRTRSSKTAAAFNRDVENEEDKIPDTITYQHKALWCTHGCTQFPRDTTGERPPLKMRYTGCEARITAEAAIDDATGKWYVSIKNEHNHRIGKALFSAYLTSSHIDDSALFSEVCAMVESQGSSKVICDIISERLGRTFTRQQLDNLKRYRMAGPSALDGVRTLLSKFVIMKGSSCLIVEDEEGLSCGLVFQTNAQRAIFNRWGDSLLLDWTHNTNNMGYYLGSLMVTMPSGKGVSVLDFLAVTQSKAMMRAIFEHFVQTNPSALSTVESIVIDKDYKEWQVLEEVFPCASVVLCQFHVLKWFKDVVAQPKYNIDVNDRKNVLSQLRSLVYAETEDEFSMSQTNLKALLSKKKHATFHAYLEERWFACRNMWSNIGRGTVFTAANTTTNRLESNWNQVKQILGRKSRMDKCLQAVFTHATLALRREAETIADYLTKSSVIAGAHPFVRRACAELSVYACRLVLSQWNRYVVNKQGYKASAVEGSASKYDVNVTATRTARFTVDVLDWSCSCHFFCGSRLPCRHLLFVARDVQQSNYFPITAIHRRWRMLDASDIHEELQEAIQDLSGLRLRAQSQVCEEDFGVREPVGAVVHVRIGKGVGSGSAVLTDLEKRNIVDGETEVVRQYLMRQGTARFKNCVEDLRKALDALMVKWTRAPDARVSQAESDAFDEERTETEGSLYDDCASDTESEDWQQCPSEHEDGGLLFDFNEEDKAVPVIAAKTGLFDESGLCSSLLPDLDSLDMTVFTDSQASSLHLSTLMESQSSSIGSLPSLIATDSQSVGGSQSVEGSQSVGGSQSVCSQSVVSQGASENMKSPMAVLTAASPVRPVKRRCSSVHDGSTHKARRTISLRRPFIPIDEAFTPERAASPPASSENASPVAVLPSASDAVPPSASGAVLPSTSDAATAPPSDVAAPVPPSELAVPDPPPSEPPAVEAGSMVAKVTLRLGSGSSTARRAKHGVSGNRLETVRQQSRCPILLGDFVQCLQHHTSLPSVGKLVDKYPVLFTDLKTDKKSAYVTKMSTRHEDREFNFVVPRSLFTLVKSALDLQEEADGGNKSAEIVLSPRQEATRYVAKIASNVRGFSERTVGHLATFFEVKSKLMVYVGDAYWIATPSLWSIPSRPDPIPFLQEETNEVEGLRNTLGTTNMRAACIAVLESVSLKTVLLTEDEEARVTIEQVIGAIARKTRLNDAVMYFVLKMVARDVDDVEIIDPLSIGKLDCLPKTKLKSRRVVVFPINYDQAHWCIACVTLEWGSIHRVFMYDPLVSASFQDRLSITWDSWCKPFLELWFKRDEVGSFGSIGTSFVDTPKQTDAVSCGVYCIVQAEAYISNAFEIQDAASFSAFQLQVMRLRMLWLMLCKAKTRQDESAKEEAVKTFKAMNEWIKEEEKCVAEK